MFVEDRARSVVFAVLRFYLFGALFGRVLFSFIRVSSVQVGAFLLLYFSLLIFLSNTLQSSSFYLLLSYCLSISLFFP